MHHTRSSALSRIFRTHSPFLISLRRPGSLVMSTVSAMTPSGAPNPRPSASLVVVNELNEILLVHRNPKASSFAGMHVFPGGNFDSKQDQSLAMTAIRETFEESGLLLATSVSSKPSISDEILDKARSAIHQQIFPFHEFLQAEGLQADVDLLLPFTQWVTPIDQPRRFHTQFFVTFLSKAPSAGFSSGTRQERIPKHDGGQEVIEARFVHPKSALAECRQGKISFMPPQYYILSTLADILHGSVNTPEQRERARTLSYGLFGRMVINPRPLAKDANGRTILTYEGDETRGGSQGRLHRAVVKIRPGAASEITLIRNFDIFSEVEAQVAGSAKL
ncbi:hypothetical protein CPB84DRAFT_1763215 [Gymnopilus junonius]|uniref:Nudix hydrolase domain-containing protein n=1 Tax=Gymnopilus junonius TaxID=109634 RepID=A0A9P5TTL7_GYMJU|nr:hypothetical protein CPB84DRAFT_1763215 [Gymnopilus junonius]